MYHLPGVLGQRSASAWRRAQQAPNKPDKRAHTAVQLDALIGGKQVDVGAAGLGHGHQGRCLGKPLAERALRGISRPYCVATVAFADVWLDSG